MKKHKHIIIHLFVMILCSSGLAYYSDSVFYGLSFSFNPRLTIVSVANFCVMANCLKTTRNSLLKNDIVNAVRYEGRKVLLKIFLIQKMKVFVVCSIINLSFLFLFEFNTCKISVKNFIFFIVLNVMVNSLLFLIQYFFELFINIDSGLLFITGIYIVGILSGCVFYGYYTTHNDKLSQILLSLNKLNVLNYTSLERINEMNTNICAFVSGMFILFVLIILILKLKIKKVDILGRD
ncbi:MAG: hypothetical protein IJA87_00080 [Clostridia bacterium]|nr:hypothetical protein [Clostridia bacterium]